MSQDLRTAAATLSDLVLHGGSPNLTGPALAVRAALASTGADTVSTPDPKKPQLKKVAVTIAYTSAGGTRMKFTAAGGVGTAHAKTGEPVPPHRCLLASLQELTRLAALIGYEEQAREAVAEAIDGVLEWRATP